MKRKTIFTKMPQLCSILLCSILLNAGSKCWGDYYSSPFKFVPGKSASSRWTWLEQHLSQLCQCDNAQLTKLLSTNVEDKTTVGPLRITESLIQDPFSDEFFELKIKIGENKVEQVIISRVNQSKAGPAISR